MKLVDRNVREVTDEEWNWAELVIISGMIVQKEIREQLESLPPEEPTAAKEMQPA